MKRWLVVALAALLLLSPASADIQFAPNGRTTLIYQSNAIVGNGADTTEDVLYTATLPVGTFANIGNTVHVVVRGTTAGTTDAKVPRLRFGGIGGTPLCPLTSNTVSNTIWIIEAWIWKAGSNAQTWVAWCENATNNITNSYGNPAQTDTAPITLVVTGQNTTAATANSIQTSAIVVWSVPGQ